MIKKHNSAKSAEQLVWFMFLNQIFASKYKTYLPTEKELQKELEEERKLIEQERKLKE